MSFMRTLIKAIGCLFAAAFAVGAFAEADLPAEPLSLSEALAYAGRSNHLVRQRELDVEAARVNLEYFEAGEDLHLEAPVVRQAVNRAELALEHQRQLHRIEIMQKFFNVLLADLDYAVKNEKMTLAFLRYSRLLEEMEMYDAHAEVDVLALETIYRERFHVRQAAALNQISARRYLGQALGISDYIPRDLAEPDVSSYVERPIPEFEDFLAEVSEHSFEMADAKMKLQSARNALKAAEKQFAPKLEAVIEGAASEKGTGSRSDSLVGPQSTYPLIAGKTKARALKLGGIEVERAQSELNMINDQHRTRAFELWKKLKLLEVELAAANVRSDFRDQYMDRSRALYELEEKSDLGDAQAELLFAYYEMRRIEFALALAWAEVDIMKGVQAGIN